MVDIINKNGETFEVVGGKPTIKDIPDNEIVAIAYATANIRLWTVCEPILKPEYFSREMRPVISVVRNHASKYGRVPSRLAIKADTGINIPTPEDADDPAVQEAIIKRVETYCRNQATLKFVEEAYETIVAEPADQSTIENFVSRMKEISKITAMPDLGVELHDDFEEVLSDPRGHTMFPTGYDLLDDVLGGGVTEPSINLVSASSGEGKSVFLANMAVNYANMGENVVFVSLELPEPIVMKRLAALVTDIPINDISANVTAVGSQLKMRRAKGQGLIQVKKMSIKGTTVAEIKSYVTNLESHTGLKWNRVIIDYMDLLQPGEKGIRPTEIHIRDKIISQEMYDWAHGDDHPRIIWTASQQVKGAKEEKDARQSGVSGGVDKVNISDNVLILKRKIDDIAENRTWAHIEKGRHGGTGMKIPFHRDPQTQKMTIRDEERRMFEDGNNNDKDEKPVVNINEIKDVMEMFRN